MGHTGIEKMSINETSICNRYNLVDREPAAQLHEADWPAIGDDCSGIQRTSCLMSKTAKFRVDAESSHQAIVAEGALQRLGTWA